MGQCAICMDDFNENDNKKVAELNCSKFHIFHVECIKEWVKKNVMKLTDEEIEDMQKQIDSEPAPIDPNAPDQNMQDGQDQQDVPEPVDNTYERGDVESDTPQLDSDVTRITKYINK